MGRKTKTCPICGNPMYQYAKSCIACRSQTGINNGNWKGGKSKDNYSYKLIQKERYPERIKARDVVCHAIKDGRITRGNCGVCGKTNAEAHHEDYNKPLDIVWLCKEHHKQRHLT